ncbi:hypothetical protein WEI85_43620 [Actinomycetes bacterium KLBMP 9797]
MTGAKRVILAAVTVGGLLAAGITAAPAASAVGEREETPVPSNSPVTDVVETAVRVKIPLPATAGSRPPECDWLSYLRYRHAGGPDESAEADKVLIAQPGVLEGAGAFDAVARNTVSVAAAGGQFVEFWALDRRSNCLEDNRGIRAGLAAGNARMAVDYYYRGAAVDGRRFAGYLGNDQVTFLQHVGLEQTMRDQFDLLAAELPDQQLRKEKVVCGGHSLGGVLTAFFASWDFDGDPATLEDAGFNQCSGYFALDSQISTSLPDIAGSQMMVPAGMTPDPNLGFTVVQAGLRAGAIPRTLSGPAVINAETMNVLTLAGLAALVAPDEGSTLVADLPRNVNLDVTMRLLLSKNVFTFLSGSPQAGDFRLTNGAVLGALMDDNSQPLGFLQTSVGFFAGGRIVDKEFPLPRNASDIPVLSGLAGMFGKEPRAIPDEPNGPLYVWRNYDEVGPDDDPVPNAADGTPFTTAGKEVTDLQQLARSMAEQPLDFTEDYFPTKIITDIQQSSAAEVSRNAVHQDGITANPTITLIAGDGLRGSGAPPPPFGETVVAAGYQHLDVLTADATQNDGRPEPVSTSLARFAMER